MKKAAGAEAAAGSAAMTAMSIQLHPVIMSRKEALQQKATPLPKRRALYLY